MGEKTVNLLERRRLELKLENQKKLKKKIVGLMKKAGIVLAVSAVAVEIYSRFFLE